MQYSVPQFIDIEDKIIGPLTLKQFLILLFGGLILFFYWSIFKAGIIFFVLALPTIGFFAMLAFAKFNGRTLMSHIPAVTRFYFAPKDRIFKRTAETALVIKKQPPISAMAKPQPEAEQKASRLARLAYLLDQKTAEEERLIHSGKMPKQWINEI